MGDLGMCSSCLENLRKKQLTLLYISTVSSMLVQVCFNFHSKNFDLSKARKNVLYSRKLHPATQSTLQHSHAAFILVFCDHIQFCKGVATLHCNKHVHMLHKCNVCGCMQIGNQAAIHSVLLNQLTYLSIVFINLRNPLDTPLHFCINTTLVQSNTSYISKKTDTYQGNVQDF